GVGPGSPGGPGGPGNGPGGPPGRGGPAGPCPAPRPDAGPSLAALVTITIPLNTWQGRSGTPGEAGGFGLLDGDSARDLAAAAARHPRTRWCITTLNPDGTAAAHGCLPGPHPPPRTRPAARHPPAGLDRRPAHHDDPDRPRHLRPRTRRTRVSTQPQTPAPGP